jgi:NO-binding membrane sensor protein with MHYT domain
MQGILYEEPSIWLFLLVTVIMGGWAAWRAGRAIAQAWKPALALIPAALALGLAVRFLHFALFEGTLLSAHFWLVDSAFCLGFAWLGWRFERANTMARQYAFAFRKAGPFAFSRKG